MSDLSENSISYRENADIYQLFSDAEDNPGHVLKILTDICRNKKVLDLGCGNGKYTHLLQPCTQSITGADKSWEQIKKAKNNYPHIDFIQTDCQMLPFIEKFDVIFCCWMLGTLVYPDKQINALKEMRKSLNPNGRIILVENDTGGEFERIRGRALDTRTSDYNDFLLEHGFKVIGKIDTFFQFQSQKVANHTFNAIWENKILYQMQSNTLEHKILVFSS